MSQSKGLHWAAAHERLANLRVAIESITGSEERREALQRERAAVLARPPREEDAGHSESILVFRLGAESYGVPLARVTEVAARPPVAPAPGAPARSPA